MRTLERNCGPFSSKVTATFGAVCAQVMAAKKPAAPPPATTTRRELMRQIVAEAEGSNSLQSGPGRGTMLAPSSGWYCPATPKLVVAVIVTLIRQPPSLNWEWRLRTDVRSGDWIGPAPGPNAGDWAAERGSGRVAAAATGGKRAEREEPKSKEQARNILGTCLQHPCDYGGDSGVLRCWQGEVCGLGPAGWRGCLAATAFRWWCQDAPARRL